MQRNQHRRWFPLLLLAGLLPAGCAKAPSPGAGEMPPPEVEVSLPVTKRVVDYEDFPGRTEAVNSVDIRARVNGYLNKANFTEGAIVSKGEVLFEIDPRPYEADVARAEANLAQADARSRRLNQDFERATGLLATRAIGREEYDKIAGDRNEAAAAVAVARSSLELSRLNLSFTKVLSPINGRVSRRYIDPGNLVKADDSILTTVVELDPVYVYFDVDERATLRLKQLVREGKLDLDPEARSPVLREAGPTVLMALANEEGFPHRGSIDFADNRVDSDTGTWRLRGVFDNPRHSLSSGLFVHIRLPIGDPYKALLVAEQALGTDQGQRFVYVVGKDNKIEYKRVQVGRLHDGLRVITSGLKPDEAVVVTGLQRVRPTMPVKPKPVPMPASENKGPAKPVEKEKHSPSTARQ